MYGFATVPRRHERLAPGQCDSGFQGQGCFLTDARTHRGNSGAPVATH